MIFVLNESEMETLFQRIHKDYETFGSVEESGEIVFDRIDSFSEISDEKSSYAPKDFLITRSANILEVPKPEKKAVFGIKSCDLRGFQIMDLQILGKDLSYTTRRENTMFVNSVCTEMCHGGFCTAFGGPVLDKYDIQVMRSGDEYYVQASEKFRGYFRDFRPSDDDPFTGYNDQFSQRHGKIEADGIENRIKWSSSLWTEYAKRCISCGACNYSCPTCYCVDIYDDEDGRKQEWDSCILEGFTRTSAGNIRPDLSDRLRQRFFHKYKYYKLSRDEYLCTGCNRCVDDCPVDIDIKEVITHDYTVE
ncbi:MAG: 4Fe-4S dicluster domain-containing protein [Thermoplasmata archaeon]